MKNAYLFVPVLLALLVLCAGCPELTNAPNNNTPNNNTPNDTTPNDNDPAPEPDPDPDPDGVPQAILDMEMDTHVAINAERAAESLGALTMDEGLRAVARAHSQDMVDRDFFSHTNPDGDSVGARLADAGISYRMAGENIAWNMGFADPVTTAVDGWMNSPGHRANILRPEFTHTGIGVAVTAQNAYYFTQVFTDPSKSLGSRYVEIYTYGPIAMERR